MKRLRSVLQRSEFHTLLFVLGFALLNWPFLDIFRLKRPAVLLAYIYILWAIGIVLLFLVSRIFSESASGDEVRKRKDHGA